MIENFTGIEFEKAADEIATGILFNTEDIRRGAKEFYSLEEANKKYIGIYNRILGQ